MHPPPHLSMFISKIAGRPRPFLSSAIYAMYARRRLYRPEAKCTVSVLDCVTDLKTIHDLWHWYKQNQRGCRQHFWITAATFRPRNATITTKCKLHWSYAITSCSRTLATPAHSVGFHGGLHPGILSASTQRVTVLRPGMLQNPAAAVRTLKNNRWVHYV